MAKTTLQLTEKEFGPLWKYINDDTITDIDYNGDSVLVRDINNNRWFTDIKLSEEFVGMLCKNISNAIGENFNKTNNVLEVDTDCMRFEVIHESAATSGRAITIRKMPMYLRYETPEEVIERGLATKECINFLLNCVKAKLRIDICGEIGAGKTELARFLSSYIPKTEKAFIIDDQDNWHYRDINPGADCISISVSDTMSYDKALKTALRSNATWVMLSEARGEEVKSMIQCWTSGAAGISTIHTLDARNISDRILNMMPTRRDADRLENDVYEYVNIGVRVAIKKDKHGNDVRRIDQVCTYNRENKQNYTEMILADGEIINNSFSTTHTELFRQAGVQDPFAWNSGASDKTGKEITDK